MDRELSLRLYDVLDWVGASEEMRKTYCEQAVVCDIVHTTISQFFDHSPSTYYSFGSNCEGTTTNGLHSDLDVLFCFNTPVVDQISDAPQHCPSLLMVKDETTKPGYCKLQSLSGKFQTYSCLKYTYQTDQHDRLWLQHVDNTYDNYEERNGPAYTRTGKKGMADVDAVLAFRCQKLSKRVQSWEDRITNCTRLNKEQKTLLQNCGCFLVGVNHPCRRNGPIEWRLSFSLQERELMLSLNPTQHKCYVLLKMIKKDIIQAHVTKSISSYHCKTCVLYAVADTKNDFWTPENLLQCTLLCINLLLRWVREKKCPNYFIPEENMFDRLEHETLRRVQDVLGDMVKHWSEFLWSLKCDDVGEVLYDVQFGRGPSVLSMKQMGVINKCILMYRNTHAVLLEQLQQCIRGLNRPGFLSFIVLLKFYRHLKQIHFMQDQTEQNTRLAIDYFVPHINLLLTQFGISSLHSSTDRPCLNEGKECDVISAQLVLASDYLQSNNYDMCEKTLYDCRISLKSHVLSVCGCQIQNAYFNQKTIDKFQQKCRTQYITYKEFAATFLTGCLTFPRCLANLVPQALHYEMYRSVGTPSGSRFEVRDDWFDWIVVDSRVYLFFLQYVLFAKKNDPSLKQDAVYNIVNSLKTDSTLGHPETALNLLGWIFKQENKTNIALECFVNSWRIRPNHNAAKWHVLVMIYGLWCEGNAGF